MHKKVMQSQGQEQRKKTEVNSAKRDELIGLGRMRQTTDNGWADWLAQMMEILRVSHGPSCLSPLRSEAVPARPLCLQKLKPMSGRSVCSQSKKTRMMSPRRVGAQIGNWGIRGRKSQGLLQRTWVQGTHSFCFLLLLSHPYSAFFSVTK